MNKKIMDTEIKEMKKKSSLYLYLWRVGRPVDD